MEMNPEPGSVNYYIDLYNQTVNEADRLIEKYNQTVRRAYAFLDDAAHAPNASYETIGKIGSILQEYKRKANQLVE